MSKCEEPICALLLSVAVSPKLLAFSAALNVSICPFIASYSSIQYPPIQDQGWSWLLRLELERLGSKYPLIHSFIGIRSISGPWKGELFCLLFILLDGDRMCTFSSYNIHISVLYVKPIPRHRKYYLSRVFRESQFLFFLRIWMTASTTACSSLHWTDGRESSLTKSGGCQNIPFREQSAS